MKRFVICCCKRKKYHYVKKQYVKIENKNISIKGIYPFIIRLKKKQDAKLPQLKITPQTNNTMTIKRPNFSSAISFTQICTQRSCPVNLPHPGSSHSEECAQINWYSQ